ncbi:hypothetical protein J6590_031180 [Homalodisca vitripennis]|nr:hypothetical protein J6590_031180 [Homalodisca vitripennis]
MAPFTWLIDSEEKKNLKHVNWATISKWEKKTLGWFFGGKAFAEGTPDHASKAARLTNCLFDRKGSGGHL